MAASDVDGIVEIQGKVYQTVALRLKTMRQEHQGWGVRTQMLRSDDEVVVMCAEVCDEHGRVIGSGHAEEKRGANNINRSSALENCETSAVGRALANAGYLGVDIASAEEMEEHRSEAIVQYFIDYLKLVREHWDVINQFKVDFREVGGEQARDRIQRRLPHEEFRKLWRAPSKGSVFSTEERDKTIKGPLDVPDPDADPDNVKME